MLRNQHARTSFSIAAAALSLFTLSPAAQAQINVAICAAASTTSTACQFTDVQAKLMATGQFNVVDIINVTPTGTGTPTLPQLQAYAAVICWTNNTPTDNNAWGDVLADYVDQGGGVVVTVFANNSLTVGRNIGGRWQLGYEVILDQSGNQSGNASLGTVALPAHPVMNGVNSLFGGTAMYRPVGTALEVGSFLIAEWSDGKVLAAQGANPHRVDLGMYPPSNACTSTYWDVASDGALLMANALTFVGTASGCPSPVNYCTSGTTTNGCNPTLSASGTPSIAAASGFTLTTSNVEGNRSGLLFYGVSGQAAVSWGPGSTSFLCIKVPTQRMATQSSGGTTGVCDGVIAQDFLAFLAANPAALGSPFSSGAVVDAQCWFRDPPAVKTTNLSDGLEFTLCP